MCMRQPSSRLCMEEEFGIGIEDEVDDFLCFHSLISSILLHSSLDPGLCFSVQYQYSPRVAIRVNETCLYRANVIVSILANPNPTRIINVSIFANSNPTHVLFVLDISTRI